MFVNAYCDPNTAAPVHRDEYAPASHQVLGHSNRRYPTGKRFLTEHGAHSHSPLNHMRGLRHSACSPGAEAIAQTTGTAKAMLAGARQRGRNARQKPPIRRTGRGAAVYDVSLCKQSAARWRWHSFLPSLPMRHELAPPYAPSGLHHPLSGSSFLERLTTLSEAVLARSLSDFPTFRPETPSETIGSESPRPRR